MSEKKQNLTRRDFIKTAGVAGAGTLLIPGAAFAGGKKMTPIPPPPPPPPPRKSKVPTRTFGRSGIKVSQLSLGGMFDIPNSQLMLKQAIKWGVTYWDTADCYMKGASENGIGMFFEKYPDQRKKIFLVTKSDKRDPAGMTELLKQSLERMKTGYIDLYFVHGVKDFDKEINENTKKWAEQAKKEGKIKLFGFSTHANMEDCMLAAARTDWIDGIMMKYDYRLMHSDKMKKAVQACAKAGIGMTAMKTQAAGPVKTESEAEVKLIGKFLEKNFTDKQASLMAVWENQSIASICSQMPNMTILSANMSAALNRTRLSAAELDLFQRHAAETSSSYCAGCGSICEECTGGVPVCDVMRYMMYYNSYGDHDRAREHFAELPDTVRDQLARADYALAERKCPQNLPIARLMQQASEILA